MKKAFTLLEVVISITIFMIILVFIYKVIDDTKVSNDKFEEHIYKAEGSNDLYKIIVEDIAEARGSITLQDDRDKNTIVTFQSNNSFNNPFYLDKTYLISSNNHLVRIESKDSFKKEKSGLDFYNNSFIDILKEDINKFIVLKKEDKIVFIIEPKEGDKIMFPTFKINENNLKPSSNNINKNGAKNNTQVESNATSN